MMKSVYQLVEVQVVYPDDFSLVAELSDVLVLKELDCGEARAGQGKLNRVTPNLSLVGHIQSDVVL